MKNLPIRRCRALALAGVVLVQGCGVAAMPVASSFRPDAESPDEHVVTGRDCSFHLAGLPFRDLDARLAARHALEGAGSRTLHHVSSRVVYSAPFEVCVEVEGMWRGATGQLEAAPTLDAVALTHTHPR